MFSPEKLDSEPGDTVSVTCEVKNTGDKEILYKWYIENGRVLEHAGLDCGQFVANFCEDSLISHNKTIQVIILPTRVNGPVFSIRCRILDAGKLKLFSEQARKYKIKFSGYQGSYPQWVYDCITFLDNYKSQFGFTARIYRLDYNGDYVYWFNMGCRDALYPFYDEEGNVICHGGGKDGHGDGM
ncbi:MAG: hypothetical protein P8X42_18055 [Calditrichaceae bacterium]